MIIYVHSYDIFDAGITWSRHSSASDVQHIVLREKDTIQSMINRIIGTARNERSIYTLVINAHGLVNGHGTPLGRISISDVAALSATTAVQMERLRSYFSDPGNGLELHCCELLAAGDGWTMCRTLSRCLNINVYASAAVQRGVSPWYSSTPSDERGRFEGRTYRFRPDGTFIYSDPELRRRGLHE